ncbi:TetR/AcrR family transcriptional regulator [Nocardioides sp. zg-1308]|uniref:TetR/AcrR family transcriptional regulator n=1 Tax=Nocardioides renjunii TaxID=3095075 RepID=A0ABU5K7T8_9ACTN|nr:MULTISPECIES: TetR/AcrR family transcriptional regulator [unclassified Nocardioides]MDZ5661033.1 TetR/AcrR family transcriptional regulator [Nocardioides sp. S-58]NPD04151.1 TetR/AcrR family transcriptional regulator [Nocardioides sp. zg-1308]WQQ22036.1 TetR/AcrR family transcriptional regulator [Nocardioides sp. S-34]
MARPRTVSDDDFVAAAATAAARRGDGSWSLSEVAAEVGVTPAAVVKRFGSKRGLLLAVVTAWVRDLPVYDPASVDDPLGHVRDWVTGWLATTADPGQVVGHLTLLLDEIVDDETRPLLARGREGQAAYLRSALRDAYDRGQLRREPPADTAALWLDLLAGVAVASAIDRTGQAATRALAVIDNDMERWREP